MRKLLVGIVVLVIFSFLLIAPQTITAVTGKNINGVVNSTRYFGGWVTPSVASVGLKPGYACQEPPFSQIIQVKLLSGKQKGKLAWYYISDSTRSNNSRKPRPFGYIMGAQDLEKPVTIDCIQPITEDTIQVSLPSVDFYGAI